MTPPDDRRHHVESLLVRESLLDRAVERSTETPVVRMLPDCHVIKIGGRSIMDGGRALVYPVVDALAKSMQTKKLIIGTGGGVRTRHVFSIGIDLGLPTGALAPLAQADALGTAHMLGTLLAPYGVVAPPPEIFGHLTATDNPRRARGHLQRRTAVQRCGSIRRGSGASHRTAPTPGSSCSPSALAPAASSWSRM